jgi:hypothetical protein
MTVHHKFRARLAEDCNTPTQREASHKIATVITKVLRISRTDTTIKCKKTRRRAQKILAALGVPDNRREGVQDAIQACAARSGSWQRTVAQLIVDMVGQGDDIRLQFPRGLELATPSASRLAPSLIQADDARRRKERERIEALHAATRVDCDKCGACASVNVRVSKQGKKGGAGGKAADVAHYECIVCTSTWCDTNE